MALIGEVSVAITGDTSALQAATRKGSEEMRQFARDALQSKRIIESLETPTQTYARKLAELTRLQQAGHLSTEQFSQAQSKLQQELQQTEASLDKTAKASREPFGKEAIQSAVKYAAAMASIGTAVSAVRDALAAMHEQGREGAEGLKGLSGARGDLAQVATSAFDLRQLEVRGDALAKRFGLDRREAAALVFAGRSEGFEDALPTIADAGQLVGVDAASTVGGQFRNLFKGEGLTSKQAISATLRAAGGSRARFAELASAAPIAAETAGAAGTGSAETLALLSVLTGEFASSKTAADRIKAFNARIGSRSETKGLGTLGAFRKLQGLTDAERTDILGGSQEVNAVFEKLQKLAPKIAEETAKNQADVTLTTQGLGALEVQRGIQESSANFRATRAARQAAVAKEISQEQEGRIELERQGLLDSQQADVNRRGGAAAVFSGIGRSVAERTGLGFLAGRAGASDLDQTNRELARVKGERADRVREANEAAMLEHLARIAENTGETDEESEIVSLR